MEGGTIDGRDRQNQYNKNVKFLKREKGYNCSEIIIKDKGIGTL